MVDKKINSSIALGKYVKVHTISNDSYMTSRYLDLIPPYTCTNAVIAQESLKSFKQETKRIEIDPKEWKKADSLALKDLNYVVDHDQEKEGGSDKKPGLGELFSRPSETSTNTTGKKVNPNSGKLVVNLKYLKDIPFKDVEQRIRDDQKGSEEDAVIQRYNHHYSTPVNCEQEICKRVKVGWETHIQTPNQILITCKSLRFATSGVEPFFCTLALYDLKSNRRLTESFHFDFNTQDVLAGNLLSRNQLADSLTRSKHAVFNVDSKNEHIYLVLKVQRVFQGNPNDGADIYVKAKKRSVNDVKKLKKNATLKITRLSDYRQPFAIGFQRIFGAYNQLEEGTMAMKQLYFCPKGMTDEDLMNQLTEHIDNKKPFAKNEFPEASFVYRIDELDDGRLPVNRTDPSFFPLKNTPKKMDLPKASDEAKVDGAVVKELQQFINRNYALPSVPNTHFVNLLYIYPQNVAFAKYTNVAVKLEIRRNDAKLNGEVGEKIILGKSSTLAFMTYSMSEVNYHVKQPRYGDEMKIMLPLELDSKLHLFFTFYQVKNKPTSKSVGDVIGHALLPLSPDSLSKRVQYSKCIIPDGPHKIPVLQKLPTSKYFADYDKGLVNYRTGKKDKNNKSTFELKTRLVSTVLTQDDRLSSFFESFPSRKELKASREELLALCISNLTEAEPLTVARFLQPVMSFCMRTMAKEKGTRYYLFAGLSQVIARMNKALRDDGERLNILASYARDKFENPDQIPVYQIIATQWLNHLSEREGSREEKDDVKANKFKSSKHRGSLTYGSALELKKLKGLLELKTEHLINYSWFWFELIVKSMGLELEEDGKLSEETAFMETCERLLDHFFDMLESHRSLGLTSLTKLNKNLALFLSDLFKVMKKDNVLTLIQMFTEKYFDTSRDPVMVTMRFAFFSILVDNPYFFEICEVTDQKIAAIIKSNKEDPSILIQEQFILPNILIDAFMNSMDFSEKAIRKTVFNSFFDVFQKYDFDDSMDADKKRLLASMYFPLIPRLASEKVKYIEENLLPVERRNILVVAVWVLKHVSEDLISSWVSQASSSDTRQFIALLRVCIKSFAYEGIKSRKDEYKINKGKKEVNYILAGESVEIMVAGKRIGGNGRGTVTDFKQNIQDIMSQVHRGHNTGNSKMSLRKMRAAQMRESGTLKMAKKSSTLTMNSRKSLFKIVKYEGALAANVSRVALRALTRILRDKEKDLKHEKSSLLVGEILSLVHTFLALNQTAEFYLSLYPLIRLMLNRFGNGLFLGKHLSSRTSRLAGEFLRHCTLPNRSIQTDAIALLYLILRNNFCAKGDLEFLQVSLTECILDLCKKVQMTEKQANLLRKILDMMPVYCSKDSSWKQSGEKKKFQVALKNLLSKLKTILEDNRQIAEQGELAKKGAADPAFLQDLYVQLAKAFNHVPILRIKYLKELAEHHEKEDNFGEAGQCWITIGKLYQDNPDVGDDEESNIDLLTSSLEKACDVLFKATLYEQCNDVYKQLIPLYEQAKQFKPLSKVYAKLSTVFDKLSDPATMHRFLGSYYRVAFFGKKFGKKLDGKEFVYKMPGLFRLFDMKTRLESTYSKQCGQPVKIIQQSTKVDPSTVKKEDLNIQLTYIHPYFDDDEKHLEFIEQHTGLTRFIFSTPFSKSGKAYSNKVTEQQKRHTILHVKDTFPFIKTAQEVVKTVERVLSPVESSIEDINAKTSKIMEIVNQEKPSVKSLTLTLQGCVAPTVHGGVPEIIKTFFDEGISKPEQELFRQCTTKFLQACRLGLDKNHELSITEHDKQFQENLDTSFSQLKKTVNKYIKKKRVGVRFA